MDSPCVACMQSNSLLKSELVCVRGATCCKFCKKHGKKCEDVPSSLLPISNELIELLHERKKHPKGVFLRIIEEEIAKVAKVFKNKHAEHLKQLKKLQAEEARRKQALAHPYQTRFKVIHSDVPTSSTGTNEIKPESPAPTAPHDGLLERLCTAAEHTQQSLKGIEDKLGMLIEILEKKNDISTSNEPMTPESRFGIPKPIEIPLAPRKRSFQDILF